MRGKVACRPSGGNDVNQALIAMQTLKTLADIQSSPYAFYREGESKLSLHGLRNGGSYESFRDAKDKWAAAGIARELIAADVVASGLIENADGSLVDENLNILAEGERLAQFGSVSIEYIEPDPKTYTGVKVYTRDKNGVHLETRTFATGDANFDYHHAVCWLEDQGSVCIACSSSVHDFKMHGGQIDENEPGLFDRIRAALSPSQTPSSRSV